MVLAPRLVKWSSKNPVSSIACGYNFSVCTTPQVSECETNGTKLATKLAPIALNDSRT